MSPVERRRVERPLGLALQVERHLAGRQERPDRQAQRLAAGVGRARATSSGASARRGTIARSQDLEDRVRVEDVPAPARGRRARTACPRAGAAGRPPRRRRRWSARTARDRRRAQAVARVQARRRLDLLAQVGRGVDQHPAPRRRPRPRSRPGSPAGRPDHRRGRAGRPRCWRSTAESRRRRRRPSTRTRMAERPAGDGSDAAAQAWAGRYIVTSMLTGVVSTFGACQTFFVMVSLPAGWGTGDAAGRS